MRHRCSGSALGAGVGLMRVPRSARVARHTPAQPRYIATTRHRQKSVADQRASNVNYNTRAELTEQRCATADATRFPLNKTHVEQREQDVSTIELVEKRLHTLTHAPAI